MSSIRDPIPFVSVASAINTFLLDINQDKAFIDILEHLVRIQARTIVIENNYIDKDFSDEYSSLHSKAFQSHSKFCDRIHFFSDEFKTYKGFVENFSSDNYLGFIVKRPLRVGKVGRTIIAPNPLPNFFYLCQIERTVHLLGRNLNVTGIPFIEQDGMVIRCAQAAMWMAAKYMHYSYSHPRHFPFDITNKSTASLAYSGRSLPSGGLTAEQVTVGLHNMGYFPIFHYKPRSSDYDDDDGQQEIFLSERALWNPVEKIYPYVESGIPVLIAFHDHACVVIGHKMFDRSESIRIDEVTDRLISEERDITTRTTNYLHPSVVPSSIFVDAFIIHDDQKGIYKLLPIDMPSSNLLSTSHKALLPKPRLNQVYELRYPYKTVYDIEHIIIPLPDKIYLLAEDVFEITKILLKRKQTLRELSKRSASGNKYSRSLVQSIVVSTRNPVIVRIYFIKNSDFKKAVSATPMSKRVVDLYLEMELPKFIWIAEVSIYSEYTSTNRPIYGEILFDSTANKYDFNRAFLSIHLPGLFYKRSYNHGGELNEIIDIEEPYVILRRDSNVC